MHLSPLSLAILDTSSPTVHCSGRPLYVSPGWSVCPSRHSSRLHLLKKHSSDRPRCYRLPFHVFHLLFVSFEAARAGVFDVVLSIRLSLVAVAASTPLVRLTPLAPRTLIAAVAAQQTARHGRRLLTQPHPAAATTRTAHTAGDFCRCSCRPWLSCRLHRSTRYTRILRKWLLHPSREYDVLALSGCLWLLGRWGGWEAEEKGLCKLLEEGLARQTEEGRGWLACSAAPAHHSSATVAHHLSSVPHVPQRGSRPLSDSSLSSLLLRASTHLSSSALSHLRSYLCTVG